MITASDQITVAVTVYSRRQYVCQAIASALAQTQPVHVLVVEDCGPDPGLRDFVLSQFGQRIEYIRNPERRGLFGNWNACLEYCRTPWLSILHDDDYLAPNFAESLMTLSRSAPNLGLYFGHTTIVDEEGQVHPTLAVDEIAEPWRPVDLSETVWVTPFPFPGHLFRVDQAQAVGGFRATSYYCGDWEMWCNLIDRWGAARTRDRVAYQRQHRGEDRGTNVVVRSGRQFPLSYVQHKRVLHLLRKAGRPQPFDRRKYQARFQVPTRFLLRFGGALSPRLLNYHWRLFMLTPPPHLGYAIYQLAARLMGPAFVRATSNIFRRTQGISSPVSSPATQLSGRKR
jgi:glycosyltransferase involved in cell wall biosynthesis